MFISKIFIILSMLLVGLALTAPVVKEWSFNNLQLSMCGLRQLAKAARITLWVKKNLKPTPGKSVFWSRTNGPVSVSKDAEYFAKVHRKEVLNPTLQKHRINIPSRKESKYSNKLWILCWRCTRRRRAALYMLFLVRCAGLAMFTTLSRLGRIRWLSATRSRLGRIRWLSVTRRPKLSSELFRLWLSDAHKLGMRTYQGNVESVSTLEEATAE